MKIEFSNHAIEQLKKRKIPKTRVLKTVQNPQHTTKSYRGRMLYRKDYKNKTLEVVAVYERGTIVVVTQYYING